MLLTYDSHEIYQGKEALAGLPATFGGDGEVTTLAITCRDRALGLRAVLSYSVFEDTDAIARSVRFYNDSDQPIFLEKAMSACLDMDDRDYDMITLHGSWARERRMDRRRVSHGKHAVSSLRGNRATRSIRFWRCWSTRPPRPEGMYTASASSIRGISVCRQSGASLTASG